VVRPPEPSPATPVVVVQYHPVPDSLNHAVLEAIVKDTGTNATVFELHEDRQPSAAELARTRTLVLVYPTWWGGLPGRLLQWVQEVFGPCYDGLEDTTPVPELRRVVAVTTHGSSALINRIQGDPGEGFLTRLVERCAPLARFEWHPMFGVGRSTASQRAEFIAEASRVLAPGTGAER